jgi:hypothetical protein
MRHKSETLNKFEDFVLWAENQTGKSLKRVISDNVGEFKNLFFEDFCRRRGVVQQFAPAYTPQNNVMAERSNCAILDKACCIFAQAKLSPEYWGEAIMTATELCNLLPSSTRNFSVPYTTWFGQRCPELSKLCAFGCLAYVLIPKQLQTSKMQPCCEKGIYLGYANDFSTYQMLKLESKVVCKARNVTFNKDFFPPMTGELIDKSSFYFNPFETIEIDDHKEAPNFNTYPNQENFICPDELVQQQLRHDKISRSVNEIIGDISPENILSHC